MSNRLGGKQGTSYLGTNANQPPNWTFSNRNPNQYDTQNVSLGDLWLNEENENVYVLTSLQGNSMSKGQLAMWTQLEAGGGTGLLNELTGDSGGVVTPDGSSNINIVSGISGVAFVGNTSPDNHTLTLNSTIGADLIQTLTGNSGPAVTALNGNINVVGDGTTIDVVGNAGSHTLTISAISTIVGLTGNSGGEVHPNSGGNINIVGDGVGITITGNPGTHTLTASLVGSGVAEEFVTDSGTAVPSGGIINIKANASTRHAGSSVSISGSGNTVLFNDTDINDNVFIGFDAGGAATTGAQNAGLGMGALTSLTSGSNNTVIGFDAGEDILTGSNNTLLGFSTGFNYTGSENSNICIGSLASGDVATSHTLTIGSGTGTGIGELNRAFISGIDGINVGSTANIVTESGDQLGTAVLTAGSGITITPGANTITIASSGGGAAPEFFVYLTNSLNNVTGDNTHYTVIFDSTVYNNGSNFNLATGMFTAPSTGVYNFSSVLTAVGLTTAFGLGSIQINTTNRFIVLFQAGYGKMFATGSIVSAGGNAYSDMDAGDTASIYFTVGNSTKTIALAGGGDAATYFSGALV